MGERAQKVILRDGQILKYWSRWAGQTCAGELLAGPECFTVKFDRADTDWMDSVWAEGGYLVDFERRKILLYSWDKTYLAGVMPELFKAWPGWELKMVNEGVPDFKEYVESLV